MVVTAPPGDGPSPTTLHMRLKLRDAQHISKIYEKKKRKSKALLVRKCNEVYVYSMKYVFSESDFLRNQNALNKLLFEKKYVLHRPKAVSP